MAMESTLFGVAIKGDQSLRELKDKTSSLATCYDFLVPADGLRVGTLDLLMSLSDDLTKMDTVSEATCWKIYRQLIELKPDKKPTIDGVEVATWATRRFEWEEAKFQLKTPLRELCESISTRLGGLDEELKTKLAEYNGVKGALQQSERKAQGNLMVRGLTEIVKEEDMRGTVGSDYVSTLLLVVPKHSSKEFVNTYASADEMYFTTPDGGERYPMVVPRSAKQIAEDTEFVLYAVVVLKQAVQEFTAKARDKRWTVRDFVFEPNKVTEDAAKKKHDEAEEQRLKLLLSKWCDINFAEAFKMMMHLKAVRVFVESVLRYGLTPKATGMGAGPGPNFQSVLLQPKKGKEDHLHKALCSLYGGGSAINIDEDETPVPGATGEFYPYVFVQMDTEAPGIA
jgi:V-type H+-transporting ATPase subunit C